DVVVAELALVARPLLIHVLVQAGVDALQGVQAIVYLDVAAVGAFRADGTLRMQVPGPCLEAIRAGEQRADRAEFDDVAAELALILRVREGSDLHIRAALEEAKLRVAADVLGETSAARAVDAAFAVEDDMIGERIGFWKVALLLDIAADGRTVEERIILKWAFAAPVADRAVERVVDEQELQNAAPVVGNGFGLRLDDHALDRRERAGRLRLGHLAHGAVGRGRGDFDQAHAAVGGVTLREAGMVAEVGYVNADPLRRLDDVLVFRHLQFRAVDLDLNEVGRFGIERWFRLSQSVGRHDKGVPHD